MTRRAAHRRPRDRSGGRARRRGAALVSGAVLLMLSLPLWVPSGAEATVSGFTVTASADQEPYVFAGDDLVYTVTATERGGAASASPLTVTDAVPSGTTFVPGSLRCGGSWSTCAPSGDGTTMRWTVQPGVAGGSASSMSFTVDVEANDPAEQLLDRPAFEGPGCSAAGGCLGSPVGVTVLPISQAEPLPGSPSPAVADQAGVGSAGAGAATASDDQNLVVVVSRHKMPHGGGHGHGSGHGSGAVLGSGSGAASAPGRLAATGDDELGGLKFGLLAVALGGCFVLVARLRRRNHHDGSAVFGGTPTEG
jgi:uncharacterized repeat protein (TIGR01451 family)